MRQWRPTASLARSLVLATVGVAGGVVAGEPALLVLVAPFLVAAVLALLARPTSSPRISGRLDHVSLTEGLATSSRLDIDPGDPRDPGDPGDVDVDVETVTRVLARTDLVSAGIARGSIGHHEPGVDHALVLRPRRWGIHELGAEQVALLSRWGGFRWGPVRLPAHRMHVLPQPPAYVSTAEAPRPRGLVGVHRAARAGGGSELAGIRPYAPGDRLKAINWRVSARTADLHVTTVRAELDTGLLLVVDLLAEHGVSGGVDGSASSLDITIRAAAALATHAVGRGDRVAVRPVGGRGRAVPSGAGRRHLQRVLGSLTGYEAGSTGLDDDSRLVLRVPAGTTVVVLTPLLAPAVTNSVAELVRRGLPVVVVDTLPSVHEAAFAVGPDPEVAALAWRMRVLDRELLATALAALGCPVVPWGGAGTVEEVLRRLARRGAQPRTVTR